MTRTKRRFPSAGAQQLVLVALALIASSVSIVPGRVASTRAVTERQGSAGQGLSSGANLARSGGLHGVAPGIVTKPGLECAPGRNGGATDVGVTGSTIRLGATVAQSGVGASFLGDVRYSMQAVRDKVNRAGGICGRRLELKLVDDGWDFQRGGEFIRNLVEQDKVFALAVVPSSEGLENVSRSGYLRRMKVPVVGSDGMLISQYTDPYIWPVAASTISTMHIMAKQAYDAGARSFGIVYEHTYHFGIEGAYAFNAAVKRLTGKSIPGYSNPLTSPKCEGAFCGITAGAASYASEIQTFNGNCSAAASSDPAHHCDFVALLLEPATAKAWLAQGGVNTDFAIRLGGPQPLFNTDFATSCGSACNGMWVWTTYLPPIGEYLGRKAVSTYVSDVRATSSSADYSNTFVQGGYLGMTLLVEALKRVGPNLTRDNLVTALNQLTLDSGLSDPLRWRAGNHFAAKRMRAFSIQYRGGFAGFRDEQVVVADPWVGDDVPE